MCKNTIIVLLLLLVGVIYRFVLTSNGNFLFNMDNARDMVDVREIVTLQKLRLTGPTSAIEGFYNGPAWYYLLSVPFILSGGDPYASIIMEIILWVIGGFFLLKLTSRFNILAMLVAGSLWIASDYIVLANSYAFNPNPVLFLTPLLIFLIEKYINTGKLIYSFLMWFLSGMFFNFEMNIGIFIPAIILLSVILTKKAKLIKSKSFWIGSVAFISLLLPQVLFDIKHHFIMSKAVLGFISKGSVYSNLRAQDIYGSFFGVFSATFFNQAILAKIVVILLIYYVMNPFKSREYFKNTLSIICLLFIFVPFFAYVLILPVSVNPWHLGAESVALIIILVVILSKLIKAGYIAKSIAYVLSALIIYFCASSLTQYITYERFIKSNDPSNYANEISSIDYVYSYAKGQNFKVYTFMPSVYDYPYQYLIWWYGLKKFGYLPIDYAYAPDKPVYISNKSAFSATADQIAKRVNSGLVFLIKEPNRGYNWKSGWEASYQSMELLSVEKIGSIEIEVRREVNK